MKAYLVRIVKRTGCVRLHVLAKSSVDALIAALPSIGIGDRVVVKPE